MIAPTAALSSMPYTPDTFARRAAGIFTERLGKRLWREYGFVDAFCEARDWYAATHLAIDQGPIIIMIENYRTGLLWKLFMSCAKFAKGCAVSASRARIWPHDDALMRASGEAGGIRRARAGGPWWQDAVIYQVYPRSFQDSNGDGIGDLRGIIERADYFCLARRRRGLVFSLLHLSHGGLRLRHLRTMSTSIRRFGTLADFDELVATLHARNIRVILDYVPNHTSDQHPWFLESRSCRDNPKRDWYFWRDPAADGGPPNNWQSLAGGSSWEFDAHTRQYYCHTFLKQQCDLNWRNPAVRDAMHDVLRFWLDRGVDGFRIDAVGCLAKDPALARRSAQPGLSPGRSAFRAQSHGQ